ncbi:MAG: hydrolase [Candidatus Hydrogenedentota bacterium]
MHRLACLFAVCLGACFAVAQDAQPPIAKLDPNMAIKDAEEGVLWYDILRLDLEGRAWSDVETPYDRLPARVKDTVRKSVWRLSTHSAGMYVRFVTDATQISARWTLRHEELAMDHMPATGVSGLDLYMRDGDTWRWIAVGRPKETPANKVKLLEGLPAGTREFMLYLPLYNGVASVELGIAEGTFIAKAPSWPTANVRPIVFYGTSITQGGCASRPGMAYPAILSRTLQRPAINLGFSGNGKMDPEIADILCELDPAVYVIDCTPNMDPEEITERTVPLVKKLRAARPDTPIVLVECITPQNAWALRPRAEFVNPKNDALKAEYEKLMAEQTPGLHYVPGNTLLGPEGETESTVDGVHPTDVGFRYYALALEPLLRSLTATP